MHEEKIALVRQQIAAVRAAAEKREIRDIYVAACGGSLATLLREPYARSSISWSGRRMPFPCRRSTPPNFTGIRHTGSGNMPW